MSSDKKGPGNLSAQTMVMLPFWQQADALLGGTSVMRKAGKKYMPMHTGEDKGRYKERLELATLFNQVELTLNGWVGRPFRDGLKLGEDVSPEIVALKNNIDRQGTNLDTFARKWFRVGLAKAFCHVLIESPVPKTPEHGGPLTRQDVEDQKIRPYWLLIEPDQILGARSEVIEGEEKYVHVRILETTQEPDPEDPEFSQMLVRKIRVYDRNETDDGPIVIVRIYREDETGDYVLESTNDIGVNFIPLVTYYSDRQGFLLGKAPLQDLCDLNVKHWQEQSDQDSILRVARFPILAGAGVEDLDGGSPTGTGGKGAGMAGSTGTPIGPYTFLVSEDPQAKFYYVEHTGKAIGAGQLSLDKLEDKLAAYGSEFLKKSPDRQTATARTLDSAESISPLMSFTLDFIDAMETALTMTAAWMDLESTPHPETGEDYAGKVILLLDFGPENVSGHDISALTTATQDKVLSTQNFRREMVRRGILRDNFEEDQNKKELEEDLEIFNKALSTEAALVKPVIVDKPEEPEDKE